MTDHNPDVAAVLAPLLRHRPACGEQVWNVALERPEGCTCGAESRAYAALTAAGYAVMKLPEGVAVAHGARLVVPERPTWYRPVYAVEPHEKGEL